MDRDEFMELVYETFADEPDNVLANGIIEAADAYVEHEKTQLSQEGTTKPERKTGRWIPCSERLPFNAGYYLTTTTHNEVYCDYYYWNLNEWNRSEQVIAWMPLPEPYKEVDG